MDSAKSWHRRLLRPIEVVALSFTLLVGTVSAQPADRGTAEGVGTLESFLQDVRSLTAEFKQELWSADHKLLQTDSGTLSLCRPNRFRWIYARPKQLTVVADEIGRAHV